MIRSALIAALASTLGCTSDAAPTAPARSPRLPAAAGSIVADGPTVHLATFAYYTGLALPAGSKIVVTSYQPLAEPWVVYRVAYVGVVHVIGTNELVHFDFYTNTALDRGTMLITDEPAPGNPPEGFDATVVLHGP
jgi:hypothetical protein